MPQTLRGQLSGRFSKDDKVHLILRIMARHLMLNFIGKPDFIAYDHRYADCPGFLIGRLSETETASPQRKNAGAEGYCKKRKEQVRNR